MDHFGRRRGVAPDPAAAGRSAGWRAWVAWLGALAACVVPFTQGVFASFLIVPAWLACAGIYLALGGARAPGGRP